MALDIISTINLDLKRPNTETVYAVQYDTAGRIKAQLTNDGEAWHVPSSAGGMVSFRKSDNIGGFYDTTELGEVAVSVDENDDSIIYIALDAQTTVTATPLDHPVQMQINFYNSQGKRLSTFAFYLRVQASVLFDGDQDERPVASEWTFRILTGALGQTIKNQEEAIKWMEDNIRTQAGYVVDDTLKVEGAAGDAKKIGELFEEIVKISDSMPGYFPTTDTERVGNTKYYTRSGTAPNYVYTEFTGATFATGVTYYEYSPWNRIWIDPDDNDVAIPTIEEVDVIEGNVLTKVGDFTTKTINDVTITWNAAKTVATITGSVPEYDTVLNVYEALIDVETGAVSGWSDYLDYGKMYPIQFSTNKSGVTLFIADSTGEHDYYGRGSFRVNNANTNFSIGIKIAADSAVTFPVTVNLAMINARSITELEEADHELKSALNNMMVFPTIDVITGKYVRGDNGYTSNYDTYVCTDYVEIPDAIKNGAMSFKAYFYNYVGAAFYNASKQYISGYSGTSLGINATKEMYVRIPENAKYFRASLRASEYSSSSDFAIAYQNSYDIDKLNMKIAQNTADITSLRSNLTSRIELDEQTMVSQFAQFGYSIDSMFEQGQLLSTTGKPTTADYNKFVRSKDYIILAKGVTYYLTPQGHNFYIFFYDETYTKTSTIWGKYQPFEFTLPADSVYMKVEAKNNSDRDITPANITERIYCNGSGALYKEIETARGGEANLDTRLDDLTNTSNSFYGFTFNIPFEQGAIGGTGAPYSSATHIRTDFIKIMPSKYKINVNGYRVYVLFYDENKTWIGKNLWAKTADFEFETDKTKPYLRIVANKTSGEEISPVDNAVTLNNLGLYDTLMDMTDVTEGIIPKYYTKIYLNEKTNEIIENTVIDSGVSFAFITDLHLEDNSGSSKSLMKYFVDRTSVPFIVSGGDIPTAFSATSGNEKAETFSDIQEWLEWVDYWGAYRVYQMRGNHDYVKPSRSDNTKYYNMPNGGVHQQIMSKFIDKVDCPEKDMCYYYFDNEPQKVRFIVIDGHTHTNNYPTVVVSWITATQINWLINTLNNSDGYSIVLLSHEATDPEMPSYASNLAIVQSIAEAYKNKGAVDEVASGESIHADFRNVTGELICILSGHCHKDASHVSNGVLSITTTCDAYYNNDPNVVRTQGTITESAFDVFSIDTANKTIKTVRIGGGSNREWNY